MQNPFPDLDNNGFPDWVEEKIENEIKTTANYLFDYAGCVFNCVAPIALKTSAKETVIHFLEHKVKEKITKVFLKSLGKISITYATGEMIYCTITCTECEDEK